MYEDDEKLAETLAGPGISRSAGKTVNLGVKWHRPRRQAK